jgi:hypothetical protein
MALAPSHAVAFSLCYLLFPSQQFLCIVVDNQIRNQQRVRLFEQINKYMKQQQQNEIEDRQNSKKRLV